MIICREFVLILVFIYSYAVLYFFKLFSRRWMSFWFVMARSWWTSRIRLIMHCRQALLLAHPCARRRAHTQCTTQQRAIAPRCQQVCLERFDTASLLNPLRPFHDKILYILAYAGLWSLLILEVALNNHFVWGHKQSLRCVTVYVTLTYRDKQS